MRKILWAFLLCAPAWMLSDAKAQVYGYQHTVARASPPDGDFNNVDGMVSRGELIQTADGKLYGAAMMGGTAGNGTIFYVQDGPGAGTGAKPVPIHIFSAGQSAGPSDLLKNTDGAGPAGLTLGADGSIYGVTTGGGANGTGTLFKITPGGVLTTLYTFSATGADGRNLDGAGPFGKLLRMSDGTFYGVTGGGGLAGTGTVFRIGTDQSFSNVYSFAAISEVTGINTTGARPLVGLTLGRDGNLYGVTETGGSIAGGIAFRLTTSGHITVLHDFVRDDTPTSDGFRPSASLLLASDGNFYGTTLAGGADGLGVVFKLAPDGTYAILHHFGSILDEPPVADGQSPAAPLIELPDGNLVGTTTTGYGTSLGTIFAISKSGAYRTVFEFADGQIVGVSPSGGLTLGSNGTLYGLTSGTTSQGDFAFVGTTYALQLASSPTATISVSPQSVPLNQNYTVTWNAPEASGCDIGQDTYSASGSLTTGAFFADPGTDVYQLFCRTPFGNTTATVVATRSKPVPTITIALISTSIVVGGSAELNWQTRFASRCDASGGWSGQVDETGSVLQSPSSPGNYNYTITCTNEIGTNSATASLIVTAKPVNPPPASGGSGGGGAFDVLGLVCLLGLVLYRLGQVRHQFVRGTPSRIPGGRILKSRLPNPPKR
jgi:uncharacterized repeat protein (TIGR03803 family)